MQKLTVKCHFASYVRERVVHWQNDCFLTISQAMDEGCPLILVYDGRDIIYQAINKRRFSDARRIISRAGIKAILGDWANGKPRRVETEAEIKAQAP